MKNEERLHNRDLTPRARELRKEMTNHERKLWYAFLKSYPVQFKRQTPLNNFIADFYCPKAKLVVELDGSQHFTEQGLAYDEERSAILNGLGIAVMRFSNYDVDNNFRGVCEAIDLKVKQRSGR